MQVNQSISNSLYANNSKLMLNSFTYRLLLKQKVYKYNKTSKDWALEEGASIAYNFKEVDLGLGH